MSDISVLKHLTELKSLDLSGTLVTDFSVLKDLENLEILYLCRLKLKDISVLKHLKKLKHLYLSQSVVIDISALEDLVSLEKLYLYQPVFTELPNLGNLAKLKYINLRNSQFTDVSALKTLPAVEGINLALSEINDLSLLYDLKSLNKIDLRLTPINSEQVKVLQTKLPACHIRHIVYSYQEIDNYLKRIVPRFKLRDNSINTFFKALSEESITSKNLEFLAPLIYRTKEFGKNQSFGYISLDFEDLTFGEIIHLICKYKKLYYKIEKHAIIVYHPSALSQAELARGTVNLGDKEMPQKERANSKIEKQLEIVIPKVRFEDRDSDFIVDFLKRTTKDLSDDQTGLNILSMLKPNLKINLD